LTGSPVPISPPGVLRYLARFDGLTREVVGGGISGGVGALSVAPVNGIPMLIAGGYFARSSGAPSDYIAAFDGQD
jgi:hypothetical protein